MHIFNAQMLIAKCSLVHSFFIIFVFFRPHSIRINYSLQIVFYGVLGLRVIHIKAKMKKDRKPTSEKKAITKPHEGRKKNEKLHRHFAVYLYYFGCYFYAFTLGFALPWHRD